MNRKEKQKEISRVLPLLWNSYQHMYDVRVNRTKNFINFLLIVISVLSAISISLFFKENNSLFLLPLIFQLIALVLLFKTFFVESIVHWFKYDETLKDIENNEFGRNLFVTLKTLENWTHKYQKETGKIIEKSLTLLILSLYLTLFTFAIIYFNYPLSYLIIFVLTILTLILIVWYGKLPKYNFKKEDNQIKGEFDKWLSHSIKKNN